MPWECSSDDQAWGPDWEGKEKSDSLGEHSRIKELKLGGVVSVKSKSQCCGNEA